MKKIFFLIFIIQFTNCSFVKDKDELLINGEWVLHHTVNSKKEKDNIQLFKLKTRQITFQFYKNRRLKVVDPNRAERTIRWKWKSEEKEDIIFEYDDKIEEFHIIELSNRMLSCYQFKSNDISPLIFNFLHSDDDEWKSSLLELDGK